jgi:mono/diheme cytochrome c family protein
MRAITPLAAVSLALLELCAIVALDGTGTANARDPANSTLDGVFTAAQAKRGEAAYTGPCSRCHGYRLDGAPDDPDMLPAPPVAGVKFLRKWGCRSLAGLLEYTRATMPENNPGYLSDQEYADVIAYMLSISGMPAGRSELRADQAVLARLTIAPATNRAPQIGCQDAVISAASAARE